MRGRLARPALWRQLATRSLYGLWKDVVGLQWPLWPLRASHPVLPHRLDGRSALVVPTHVSPLRRGACLSREKMHELLPADGQSAQDGRHHAARDAAGSNGTVDAGPRGTRVALAHFGRRRAFAQYIGQGISPVLARSHGASHSSECRATFTHARR